MIYDTLRNIDNNKNYSLFLRHAERYSLGDLHNALNVLLTEKGKDDSFKFGKSLEFPGPINLFHSPVTRCKETAEYIKKGLDQNNKANSLMGNLEDLGGPFIKGHWEEIVHAINKYGFEHFIRKWFNNEISSELVVPLEEAAHTQLDIITSQLKKNNSTSINISHDWNIMLLREHFFKLTHEEIGLPDFLDGVVSYLENNKLNMLYLDKTYSISL